MTDMTLSALIQEPFKTKTQPEKQIPWLKNRACIILINNESYLSEPEQQETSQYLKKARLVRLNMWLRRVSVAVNEKPIVITTCSNIQTGSLHACPMTACECYIIVDSQI